MTWSSHSSQKKERNCPLDIKTSELITDISFHPASDLIALDNLSVFKLSNEKDKLQKKLKLSCPRRLSEALILTRLNYPYWPSPKTNPSESETLRPGECHILMAPSKKRKDRVNVSLAHREFVPCEIEGKPGSQCRECHFPMHGKNPTNLKTHLRTCNPEKLQKVEGK